MGKDRIAYLDFVKFVAILLVCVGHCYVMTPNLDSIVRPIIYSFHMPLFMLVCGYFSTRSLEIPIKFLLEKKSRQLLLPVISCTIMTVCLFGGGIRMEIIGCVWFLKNLFICYLIARFVKYVNMPVEITLSLSWVILLIIPYGGTLMINYLYFYFCVGYLIHKHLDYLQIYKVLLFSISLVFFIVALCLNWTNPPEKVDINLLMYSPFKFVVQVFVGLSGSIIVIGVCELIYKLFGKWQRVGKVLSYFSTIGRYTLGIYVVQTFIIERIITVYIKLNEAIISPTFTDFIFIPLIGSALCLVCYYLVRLTQPIKIINILFYGGQK